MFRRNDSITETKVTWTPVSAGQRRVTAPPLFAFGYIYVFASIQSSEVKAGLRPICPSVKRSRLRKIPPKDSSSIGS